MTNKGKKLIHIRLTALILLGILSLRVSAQEAPGAEKNHGAQPDTLLIFDEPFEIYSHSIKNNPALTRLSVQVDSICSTDTVTAIDITGLASIDGPVALNENLAKLRAEIMAKWLKENTKVNHDIINLASNGEDWGLFENIVKSDAKMPMRVKVLEIIRSNKSIVTKEWQLRHLDNGKVWRYLAANTFPKMRVAKVTLMGYQKQEPPVVVPDVVEEVEEVVVYEPVEEPAPVIEEEGWQRKMYVKTNAPAWLLLWINAAFEIDLAPHWSVSVPIYYSGFNYFKHTLKFRTFSVVPEVRWWTKADNTGFFLNAHLGLNQFNVALGGEHRYQTWHGHSPALGGGLGLGYRFHFCKNDRWTMEACIGAGVYHLDYSIFRNAYNGLIVGRRIRTFFGIDQAALSFAYSFGVKGKGGKK